MSIRDVPYDDALMAMFDELVTACGVETAERISNCFSEVLKAMSTKAPEGVDSSDYFYDEQLPTLTTLAQAITDHI